MGLKLNREPTKPAQPGCHSPPTLSIQLLPIFCLHPPPPLPSAQAAPARYNATSAAQAVVRPPPPPPRTRPYLLCRRPSPASSSVGARPLSPPPPPAALNALPRPWVARSARIDTGSPLRGHLHPKAPRYPSFPAGADELGQAGPPRLAPSRS